jgi:PAP2 superfamily
MGQRNKSIKRLRRITTVVCLGVVCITLAFTVRDRNPAKTTPIVAFPAIPNTVILDWNATALNALEAPNYQHVLSASRLYAMVHIAQYDALNSIKRVYKKYCIVAGRAEDPADAAAHPVAAAAFAAYTVLLHELPGKKALLDSQLAKSIDTIADQNAKQKGMALGLRCGNAIIDLRKDDGAAQDPIGAVAPSSVPGVYQTVPPFNFVFARFWKTMKPFGLLQPQQFRIGPFPDLQSKVYRRDLEEVKKMGGKNSLQRTMEQTRYAKFWYEYAEIGWNRVASVAARKANTDLLTTARLFAMINITLADAYIAGWDSKFYYNFWRPYTAVVYTPAVDGGDPVWEPLMPTPPVPDYPSTHCVLGNAAATVLTYFFGDRYLFATSSTSSDPAGAERSFNSFLSAADENADSRVMAGIHFRFSCKAGQAMGNKIGNWITKNTLAKADQ